MKTQHTATFHGHTFKRVSQSRIYTHMVVGVLSIAAERIAAETWARKEYKMNLEYYQKMAAGGTYHSTFGDGSHWSKPITELERDAARATIAAGVDGAVADRLREFDKRTAAAWKTEDGLSTIFSAGWTSRHDLALKLAAKTVGAVIVETVRS